MAEEITYPAPGDASPDHPEEIRRVNDENRTDVRQPITEPVKEGVQTGNNTPVAQPAPPAQPTPQGTNV